MSDEPLDTSPLLENLNTRLAAAQLLLDDAAGLVRDSELDSMRNITRIAEILSRISDIQDELYELEPRLIPLSLRDTKRYKKYFESE
jgi:hypothetical protein